MTAECCVAVKNGMLACLFALTHDFDASMWTIPGSRDEERRTEGMKRARASEAVVECGIIIYFVRRFSNRNRNRNGNGNETRS